MKLGPLRINLARTPAPNTDQEIGSAGSHTAQSLFNGEVIETEKVKIKDLKKMLDNDGTAQALFNVISMPILATGYDILPEDDTPEAKEQAEAIKDALTRPPHRGGMTTPFDLVIEDMLRAVVEGWRGYEKVFAIQDGKVVYRKLAQRDNSNTTLIEDDRGGFNGLKQYAMIGNDLKYVHIPREFSFIYTYGKSYHWLKGRSAFKAAYYHYDKKHRAYYLANQALQSGAIPWKVVRSMSKTSNTNLDEVVDTVDELGFRATVGLPENYELDTLDVGKGGTDVNKYIEHHNAEMARSILAQFMMLGTGSNVGSWALSSDQSDLFIQALNSITKSLEMHINSYVIPDLHDYNYENPKYATFKFNNVSDSTKELLKTFAVEIIKKSDGLPEDFVDSLLDKLKDHLGIKDSENPKVEKGQDENTSSQQSRSGRHFLANKKWRRDLTGAEKKVNFASIQSKMNTLEGEYIEQAQPVFQEVREAMVTKIEKLINQEDYKEIAEGELIPKQIGDKYRKVVSETMMSAYNFAKLGAADELNVNAPSTKQKSKQIIKQEATAIVDKQFSDLTFTAREIVNKERRNGQLSTGDTKLALFDVLRDVAAAVALYSDNRIAAGGSVIVNKAINLGRSDVFEANDGKIYGYQYSALLDQRTCPICEDLDGSVVSSTEYRGTRWTPPIHFNCRCIWVAILEEEEEKPEYTGLPDTAGGETAPTLSRDLMTLAEKIELSDLTAEAIVEEEFAQ